MHGDAQQGCHLAQPRSWNDSERHEGRVTQSAARKTGDLHKKEKGSFGTADGA
jgi:hypothetical protein